MSESQHFLWQVNENNFIEFQNGQMTVKNNWRTVTDEIENFTLKYFKMSKRLRVHFILQNFENIVQWDYRGVVKPEDKEVVGQFVYLMESHGLFQKKSIADIMFGDTEEESKKFLKNFKPGERKCPNCGGEKYHAFVEEVVVNRGVERTEVRRAKHPFLPSRSIYYQRHRYVIPPKTKQVSKFVCDDCGRIF